MPLICGESQESIYYLRRQGREESIRPDEKMAFAHAMPTSVLFLYVILDAPPHQLLTSFS